MLRGGLSFSMESPPGVKMLIRPEKMVPAVSGLADSVWQELYAEAEQAASKEPKLMGILDDVVLSRTSLGNAVAVR
ncbi:MAG: hypothetical protein IKC90_01090, partial [Akkermansia sp.]|nr:hypothetical protein [Akkermansia sp.]